MAAFARPSPSSTTTRRPSPAARPIAPLPTMHVSPSGPRSTRGSSGSRRKTAAVTSPSRSAAVVTIALSVSSSGSRLEIEPWMSARRSSSRWRSCRRASRSAFSRACCCERRRSPRSASTTPCIRSVSASVRAIPRTRLSSNGSSGSPMRASTTAPSRSSSSGTTTARHAPAPGTATSPPPAAASATRSSSGTSKRGQPIDAATAPSRTTAPTSASSASTADSIARSSAVLSSGAPEIATTNSARCWVDQLVVGACALIRRRGSRWPGCGSRRARACGRSARSCCRARRARPRRGA